MNTTVNADFSSKTISEDGLLQMNLPAHDPLNPSIVIKSEEAALLLVNKYADRTEFWFDIDESADSNKVMLTDSQFIYHVMKFGSLTPQQFVEIMKTSEDDNIEMLRILLQMNRTDIGPDSDIVAAGFGILKATNYLDDAAIQSIMDNWPEA